MGNAPPNLLDLKRIPGQISPKMTQVHFILNKPLSNLHGKYENITFLSYFHFDLFNLSDLYTRGNISPLKLSCSFYFQQIIGNQINMGNMQISHFCSIYLEYGDKCPFDLFNLCVFKEI